MFERVHNCEVGYARIFLSLIVFCVPVSVRRFVPEYFSLQITCLCKAFTFQDVFFSFIVCLFSTVIYCKVARPEICDEVNVLLLLLSHCQLLLVTLGHGLFH